MSRNKLSGLPVVEDTTLEAATVDMTQDAQLSPETATTLTQIGEATKLVDRQTKVSAWMTQFTQVAALRNKQRVVDDMNRWSRFGFGWEVPPGIKPGTASKNGFFNVQGLNIEHSSAYGGNREPSIANRPRGFGSDRGSRGYGGRSDSDDSAPGRRGSFQGGRRGRDFDSERRGRSFDGEREGRGFEQRERY